MITATFVAKHVDDAQVQWGNNRDPRGLLVPGQTYTVDRIVEHSWYTCVYLAGYDGYFNSVWFRSVWEIEDGS